MTPSPYDDLLALEKLFATPGIWCRDTYKQTDSLGVDHYCLAGGMMFVTGCTEFTSMMLLEPRVYHMYRALKFDSSTAMLHYNDNRSISERSLQTRIALGIQSNKPKVVKVKPVRKPRAKSKGV